jgi:DNA-binding NtrC family response regulator
VVELASHFLRVYSARVGKSITRIDRDALATLVAYPWPGNIRQLENAVERAVVLAEGDAITLADWPPEILTTSAASPAEVRLAPQASPGLSTTWRPASGAAYSRDALGLSPSAVAAESRSAATGSHTLESEVERFERERLAAVLTQCRGNKSEAARLLGLPRSTLFSKLRKYNLG